MWGRTCEDPIIDDVLTRLKVEGFKNLDRIDVRLGPFTCVAGPNGVGKSNLFDAISFLAALADKPRSKRLRQYEAAIPGAATYGVSSGAPVITSPIL